MTMVRASKRAIAAGALALLIAACGGSDEPSQQAAPEAEPTSPTQDAEPMTSQADKPSKPSEPSEPSYAERRLDIYATVALDPDLGDLSSNQRRLIGKLIEAGKIMDALFWRQAYGDREALLERIDEEAARQFARINYGPWDRLNANEPFVEGFGDKPDGANFYPQDMTKAEFREAELEDKASLYTLLRRDDDGELVTVPYSEAFGPGLERAAALLRESADLAENEAFARYLRLRADALLSNEYRASDMAWMEMKDNRIDVVFGPIEVYEDQLFGYKAAFEAFVLIKDMEWSRRLARFAQFLPALQDGLPVPEAYKAEEPGREAELNAYDAAYYAGDANAGAKTIAINLPNDEQVQLEKGTRRLQLKNAMRAKFDKILVPIADELIAEDQREHITFDAFFGNTMFHEVAHGLGIKNTIDGEGTVSDALKEHASAIEEGKADILGLYMVTELFERGEIQEGELEDNYVTFMASIFRSVRFGASSAHGQANMIRFNYFKEKGAFTRDAETGRYRVDMDKMREAMTSLSRKLLVLQGDGDYEGASQLIDEYAKVGEQLQGDLDRLAEADVPVDIVFDQGKDVLGLAE